MARGQLTWRNVAAPDATGAARILDSAARNWTQGFDGAAETLLEMRERQKQNRSADIFPQLAQVAGEGDVDAALAAVAAGINPRDMTADLRNTVMGLRETALGYDDSRSKIRDRDGRLSIAQAANARSAAAHSGKAAANERAAARLAELQRLAPHVAASIDSGKPVQWGDLIGEGTSLTPEDIVKLAQGGHDFRDLKSRDASNASKAALSQEENEYNFERRKEGDTESDRLKILRADADNRAAELLTELGPVSQAQATRHIMLMEGLSQEEKDATLSAYKTRREAIPEYLQNVASVPSDRAVDAALSGVIADSEFATATDPRDRSLASGDGRPTRVGEGASNSGGSSGGGQGGDAPAGSVAGVYNNLSTLFDGNIQNFRNFTNTVNNVADKTGLPAEVVAQFAERAAVGTRFGWAALDQDRLEELVSAYKDEATFRDTVETQAARQERAARAGQIQSSLTNVRNQMVWHQNVNGSVPQELIDQEAALLNAAGQLKAESDAAVGRQTGGRDENPLANTGQGLDPNANNLLPPLSLTPEQEAEQFGAGVRDDLLTGIDRPLGMIQGLSGNIMAGGADMVGGSLAILGLNNAAAKVNAFSDDQYSRAERAFREGLSSSFKRDLPTESASPLSLPDVPRATTPEEQQGIFDRINQVIMLLDQPLSEAHRARLQKELAELNAALSQ